MAARRGATSDDAVLGGKLVLRQPLRGHRFGHDAILLAAATSARAGEHAVELGAGVGTAGLALARRIEGLTVTLVEIDPALAELARHNAETNGFAPRVRSVCLDVVAAAAEFAAAGLAPGSAHRVLMNPPFNAADHASPDDNRRRAHSGQQLRGWVRAASRLLRRAGVLTLIWRADGLPEVLASLESGFGKVSLLPIYPKPGAPAIRLLVSAVKESRGPVSVLPGLVLADERGTASAQAEAVLREAQVLPLSGC